MRDSDRPGRWSVTIGYGPDDPRPHVTRFFDCEPDIETIKAHFGVATLWYWNAPPTTPAFPCLVEVANLTLDNGSDYVQ